MIDPFGEIGVGYIGKDYLDEKDDQRVTESTYWFAGGGLGVNLGFLGIFAKVNYMIPFSGALKAETTIIDSNNNQVDQGEIEDFALKPYRVVIGVKLR